MTRSYRAAKGLIEGLWFVPADAFDDECSHIHFDRIEAKAKAIAMSTTERLRVQLSRHLFTGTGTVNLADLLSRADPKTGHLVVQAVIRYAGKDA